MQAEVALGFLWVYCGPGLAGLIGQRVEGRAFMGRAKSREKARHSHRFR